MDKESKIAFTIAVIVALVIIGFFAALFGNHTTHYNCKYVDGVKVLVADKGKYDSALYELDYSDGTKGVTSDVDYETDGAERGTVCQTVFQWGFPLQGTNRNVKDEPIVREQ